MAKNTISVIVPCYNAEGTIERCVSSLLNQTYSLIEIILINDGSKDKTGEILDELQNRFYSYDLRVIQQNNMGVSETRNLGINIAKGDFISFVDADDFVEPTFFEDLITPFFDNAQISLSVVGVEKSEKVVPVQSERRLINSVKYFEEIFKNKDVKGYPCNKLYKKQILLDEGVYFDTRLSILEDLEFNVRYSQYVDLVSVSPEKSYHYIIQENSAMASPWTDKKLEIMNSFSQMEQLPFLTKGQKEMVQIEKVRMLIWLAGQLYRTGNDDDIKRNEKIIFNELSSHKRLFLTHGYYTGLKYYASYLLFCIYPGVLYFLAKL